MITTILTDIEGTTSSFDFVREVLSPYSELHLPQFIQAHSQDSEVQKQLEATREIVRKADLTQDETIQILLTWMSEDKKATPLKALQGMVWEIGYKDQAYKAHVYPDAVTNLQKWHTNGKKLYVYSSGSIQAQQLFFSHTEYGDLTDLFSGYFDTTTGHKREKRSYRNIAERIDEAPSHILFLSDVVEELDAAQNTGMKTYCLNREDRRMSSYPHPQIRDFDEVDVS
ncbi:acireductone synthase [Candidatus Albibeggiatoa sp. nov. BB20]|uniref:acireductone synthase n=1 Tax=Candidatus Albibeggiatoa sp. nov. BB20 TaxID=3162723 RepID=UPI0033654C9C